MHVPIARRNLLADKAKFLVALGGVTLAIVLILVVQSLYQGVRRETSSFIQALPGDLWVAQEGTTDLVFSNSSLPASAADDIRAVPEVSTVSPLHARLMSFEIDGDDHRTYVMALQPDDGLAASEIQPFRADPGTIILDRAFADESGLSSGDTIGVRGAELTVAEVRHVGNVLVTQFAFVHPDDFRSLFGSPDTVNFFLVESDSAGAAASSIGAAVDGSTVLTKDEFAGLASETGTGDFLPIIRVIMLISFVVGLTVLSLTIYSATIERAREYAIMKVLGASRLSLYRIVISQSALIASLGFASGIGLALLFNRAAGEMVPQFITYIRWQDVAFVLAASTVMTVVAAFVPINRIARVEPATVFRA